MQNVILPQMGTIEEGKILHWLKHEGDPVKQGEPLVEVETVKVNIELDACSGGILREILVREGEKITVGTVIARIGEADEPLPVSASPFRHPDEREQPAPEANNASASQRIPAGLQKGILLSSLLTLLLTLGVSLFRELWLLSIITSISVILLVWVLSLAIRR